MIRCYKCGFGHPTFRELKECKSWPEMQAGKVGAETGGEKAQPKCAKCGLILIDHFTASAMSHPFEHAESREPEKLNNAHKVFNCSETGAFHRAFGVPCSNCEPVALAESSLSQNADSSTPSSPAPSSTQPDTHTEKV